MTAKIAGARVVRACVALAVLMAGTPAAPAASASPFDRSGVMRLGPHPSASLHASKSENWFGYDRGVLGQGALFTSISANWRVPRARQHKRGQAESSATWIGIGGGCPEPTCTGVDATLIQAGTEQDVGPRGVASYSAWWELIPAPATTIKMRVSAGDRMFAEVSEAAPASNLWTITLKDLTKHETFQQTTPYTSSHTTGEWIEEIPVTISGGGVSVAALPKLAVTRFDNAQVNGAPAGLTTADQVDLVSNSGRVIGRASVPDSGQDGFAACTWRTVCRAPRS